MHNDADTFEQAIAGFRRNPVPLRLCCGVQHYEWGDYEVIPRLLGVENRERRAFAELWIGAHPDLSSRAAVAGVDVPLDTLIERAGEEILGVDAARRFHGRLPFLLKVLSARAPLSIQAHPGKVQAEAGFARENRAGLDPGDRRRNYKDANHKPELIAALTDFHALRGFRPLDEIAHMLQAVPEFQRLRGRFRPTRESLMRLYRHIMEMEQAEVDGLLTPLIERLDREHARTGFTKADARFWMIRADQMFSDGGRKDRGLFSICFLNLVELRPGQAIYLPPGELHAYLEGSGVEVMASSNNVLRGGLTRKHIDAEELLRTLTFHSAAPQILELEQDLCDGAAESYRAPAEEFRLSRLRLGADLGYRSEPEHGVHVAVVTHGAVTLRAAAGESDFSSGQAFLVPHGLPYRLDGDSDAVLFRASIPPAQESRG